MSENDNDLLNADKYIELLESRKKQLLERKNLYIDQAELKTIEKQIRQIELQLKKLMKEKMQTKAD
jgi:hypothetical protein